MPNELGNEAESTWVGYHDHRYPATGEWMDDERSENNKDEVNKRLTQKERILKKMKSKYFQEDTDHSSLPGNGGVEDLGNTRK